MAFVYLPFLVVAVLVALYMWQRPGLFDARIQDVVCAHLFVYARRWPASGPACVGLVPGGALGTLVASHIANCSRRCVWIASKVADGWEISLPSSLCRVLSETLLQVCTHMWTSWWHARRRPRQSHCDATPVAGSWLSPGVHVLCRLCAPLVPPAAAAAHAVSARQLRCPAAAGCVLGGRRPVWRAFSSKSTTFSM